MKVDYPAFEELSKEQIFSHIYSNEEYKDKKIRDLLSRMLELAQIFLSQLEFDKKNNTRNIYILQQLLERNLERHFKSRYKETEKNLKQETVIDDDYILTEHLLMKLNREQLNSFKNVQYETSFSDLIYTEYDHFLNYVILNVLHYTLIFAIRKYSLNNEINFEFTNNVIEFLDKHPREKYPVIEILRKVLKLQSSESEPASPEDVEVFKDLIETLNVNDSKLSQFNKRFMYVYLVNYSRLKSLIPNKFFKDEYYRLLKYSIEHDLYPKVNNYFAESSYLTVASEAIIFKDFDWAEKFIEKYKNELKSEVRENAYTFCMANLNYRKGDYGNALKLLVKVSMDNISYNLKVKHLQIKIHYDIGDYEMCISVIDSFRHFLSSAKQMPEFVRIRFVNYVNFTSRMVNIWLGGDPKNIIDITREINEIPQGKVESKTWLLAQAAKIKY